MGLSCLRMPRAANMIVHCSFENRCPISVTAPLGIDLVGGCSLYPSSSLSVLKSISFLTAIWSHLVVWIWNLAPTTGIVNETGGLHVESHAHLSPFIKGHVSTEDFRVPHFTDETVTN